MFLLWKEIQFKKIKLTVCYQMGVTANVSSCSYDKNKFDPWFSVCGSTTTEYIEIKTHIKTLRGVKKSIYKWKQLKRSGLLAAVPLLSAGGVKRSMSLPLFEYNFVVLPSCTGKIWNSKFTHTATIKPGISLIIDRDIFEWKLLRCL